MKILCRRGDRPASKAMKVAAKFVLVGLTASLAGCLTADTTSAGVSVSGPDPGIPVAQGSTISVYYQPNDMSFAIAADTHATFRATPSSVVKSTTVQERKRLGLAADANGAAFFTAVGPGTATITGTATVTDQGAPTTANGGPSVGQKLTGKFEFQVEKPVSAQLQVSCSESDQIYSLPGEEFTAKQILRDKAGKAMAGAGVVAYASDPPTATKVTEDMQLAPVDIKDTPYRKLTVRASVTPGDSDLVSSLGPRIPVHVVPLSAIDGLKVVVKHLPSYHGPRYDVMAMDGTHPVCASSLLFVATSLTPDICDVARQYPGYTNMWVFNPKKKLGICKVSFSIQGDPSVPAQVAEEDMSSPTGVGKAM